MKNEDYLIIEALVYEAKGNGGDFGLLEEARDRAVSQGISGGVFEDRLAFLERARVISVHESVTTDSGTWTQYTF